MYYEEKMINGVMCYRSRQDAEFEPMTLEMCSNRLYEIKLDLDSLLEDREDRNRLFEEEFNRELVESYE